jgi:glycosyltransferase involved in cell wall biosynthesis
MIVKNAEEDLRACLESARPLMDQIVIADTGSSDRTRDIAAEFGAFVVEFPWRDDFASARNAALAAVNTDWVLVLDADEELAPEAHEALPALLRGGHGIGGYQVTIRNYSPHRFSQAFEQMSRVNHDDVPRARNAPAYTEHNMTRLFRRHPAIAFTGRIHECVDPSIERLGLRIGRANFRIRHFGRLREDLSSQKRALYRELGRRKVAEEPDNPLAWYELGCEYMDAQQYPEALECMTRSVEKHPWAVPVLYIARIYGLRKEFGAALAALDAVPDKNDLGLLRNEMRGDLLHDLNRLGEARAAYQAALRYSPVKRGMDECGREALIASKLGYTEVRLGLVRMGLARLRQAVAHAPDILDNHDRLVKACMLLKRDSEAAQAAEDILNYFFSDRIYLRAAALRIRLGEKDRARRLLEEAIRILPQSGELRGLLRQIEGDGGSDDEISSSAKIRNRDADVPAPLSERDLARLQEAGG